MFDRVQDKIPTDKIPTDKIPADKIPTGKIPNGQIPNGQNSNQFYMDTELLTDSVNLLDHKHRNFGF